MDHQTSSQCLLAEFIPRIKSRVGVMTKAKRTLPKVGRFWHFGLSGNDNRFSVDAKELDTWVLDHLRDTLRNATQNPGSVLDRNLRHKGIVIFLHLLGLDTTGHSYRPFSKVSILVFHLARSFKIGIIHRNTWII